MFLARLVILFEEDVHYHDDNVNNYYNADKNGFDIDILGIARGKYLPGHV